MRIKREDKPGEFDGKGKMITPAEITINLTNMDRDEYLRMDMFIEENFPKPQPETPPRLRKLSIVKDDPVHSGKSPTESQMEVR